jgi:hypothetical protein
MSDSVCRIPRARVPAQITKSAVIHNSIVVTGLAVFIWFAYKGQKHGSVNRYTRLFPIHTELHICVTHLRTRVSLEDHPTIDTAAT